jgi:phage shock protein A
MPAVRSGHLDGLEDSRMAGLMQRASLVAKAKISKLLDHAEDPAETLDYSYEKQLELLQNVKRGVADVVTAKKRIQLQEAQLQQSLVTLETQARQALAGGREDLARQALAGGREDLARQALERKTLVQQQLQGLDQQVQQLEAQQEKLVASEQALQTKIEAFRSQKEVIKAQYSAAEAQVRVGEAATGIGEQMADTGLAIQRARDKTEEMQARAAAVDELVGTGALEDFTSGGETDLDRQVARLSAGSQVDGELARLKAELGAGAPAPKELAEGSRTPAEEASS